MSSFDILAKFLEMYPQFHDQICKWKGNDSDSIIVWFNNGQVFDFMYFSDNNWKLRPHFKHVSTSITLPSNPKEEYVGRYVK